MSHQHTPNQPNRARRDKERSELVKQLAELLWDATKPEGEEGLPEDQWEVVLTGPCNGNKQLIADVCAYERYLRSDTDPGEKIEIRVSPEHYLVWLFQFFTDKKWPISLLWDIPTSEWYPEELWDQILEQWTEGSQEQKDRLKKQARKLKRVRETGRWWIFAD